MTLLAQLWGANNMLSAHFFKMLAEESMHAIIAINAKNQCVYANPAANDLLECPLDYNTQDFRINHLFPENKNSHGIRPLNHEQLEIEGHIQEILIQKHNKQIFIASMSVKKITIDGIDYKLMLFQDLTLQKKLQREITEKQNAITQAYNDLLSQNNQLKALDLAKNRFIAVTTHELRTPLSAMVASAEILKTKLYDTQEQHDEFVAMIYDQGKHMLDLVNDILDFAKIQSNKMDYYVEHKSLKQVLTHEIESFQSMANNSKIELKFVAPQNKMMCYFDEVRVKQVTANIVNNAIKYNKPGGSVTVYMDENKSFVRVFVKDTGKGIHPDNHNKIFNEFETLGQISHHDKGTGLGLPISLRMIQAMGGTITLESEEGAGSTFCFEIPKDKVLPAENYRSRPSDTGSGDLAA